MLFSVSSLTLILLLVFRVLYTIFLNLKPLFHKYDLILPDWNSLSCNDLPLTSLAPYKCKNIINS